MNYYPVIVIITILAMIMESVHLYENESLYRHEKNYLIAISFIIICGAICEFFGVYLDGKGVETRNVHILVKVIEFCISPIIPFLYVKVIDYDNSSRKRMIFTKIFIISNIIVEMMNFIIPITFYIDESNIYRRGQFYLIYFSYYMIGILFFVFILMNIIKKYQNKNFASLACMLIFLLSSFAIRQFSNGIRCDWLVIAIIQIAFISYYSDLILKIDELTQLLNRRTYENFIKKIDFYTCIIRFDVNKFKAINDSYGHQCGDICLKIVADTLLKIYGDFAYCYRVGGDEFDVIFKKDELKKLSLKHQYYDVYKSIDNLNKEFDKLLHERAKEFPMLSEGCSKGYGIFYGFMNSYEEDEQKRRYSASTLQEVINIADMRMYDEKKLREECSIKKHTRD